MKQVWRRIVLILAGFCRFAGDALCDLVENDMPAVPVTSADENRPEGSGRECRR